MSLIIGLGSKARIGKDFAAKELAKYHDVERISFADALKEDLNYIFKPIHPELDFTKLDAEPELKEYWRPVMVAYGERMRQIEPDYWVRRALGNREFNHELTLVVDCRYPNEVNYVKQLGGLYIDIETDNAPANESEAKFSPILAGMADFRVRNDFTDQFIVVLREIVARFAPRPFVNTFRNGEGRAGGAFDEGFYGKYYRLEPKDGHYVLPEGFKIRSDGDFERI